MDSSIVAHLIDNVVIPAPVQQRTVCGIGVNDCSHPIILNGKLIRTYTLWQAMLNRCYSELFQASNPTYKGCSVAEEWLSFSKFESWVLTQDYVGKALDKDILFPGNKIYGPDTCVFVPQALNGLLSDSRAARGQYPLGVRLKLGSLRYEARVSDQGKSVFLGTYSTPEAAHKVWQLAKSGVIIRFPVDDLRVRLSLDKRAAQLREDAANGRITEKL